MKKLKDSPLRDDLILAVAAQLKGPDPDAVVTMMLENIPRTPFLIMP